VDVARALAVGVVAALAAGDVQGAQLAVSSLAALVDACDAEAPPQGLDVSNANVVDLMAERRKRGER
jgi:hypothetical protein